mmetsp:Transcript_44679/g.129237  ORF Transcript_44679/g.129237 Transcript_44679/m.129237 type:complete len:257 (-) Transcript_44679:231-1001(-)
MSSASRMWAPPATHRMRTSTSFLFASLQTLTSSGAASMPSAQISSLCWRASRASSSPGCTSHTSRRAPLLRRSWSCLRRPPVCPTASSGPQPPPRMPHAHWRTLRGPTLPSRRRSAPWLAPRRAAPSLCSAAAERSRWPCRGRAGRSWPQPQRRPRTMTWRAMWGSSRAARLRWCCWCWGAGSSCGAGAARQSPCRRRLRIRWRWRTPRSPRRSPPQRRSQQRSRRPAGRCSRTTRPTWRSPPRHASDVAALRRAP